MSTARQHHWIPQCYLKGFARSRSKKSKLTVFDVKQKKQFETVPRNVGGSRDFNRVDRDGVPPDAVENALSGLETKLDRILSSTIESSALPHGDDFILLMNFVALMNVRNPRVRETWRKFQADVSERIMDLALSSKDVWEHQINKARADGVKMPDVSYEEMKEFHQRKEYDIVVPTGRHVSMEVDALTSIIPLLLDRKWTLFVAQPGTGGFVSSDHPVALYWNDDKPRRLPPGHKLLDTEVTFPISKELLMSGTFDGENRVVKANIETVARANSIVISHSGQQIYSSTQYIHYLRSDGESIGRGPTFMSEFDFW